jgi:hypothetical protein
MLSAEINKKPKRAGGRFQIIQYLSLFTRTKLIQGLDLDNNSFLSYIVDSISFLKWLIFIKNCQFLLCFNRNTTICHFNPKRLLINRFSETWPKIIVNIHGCANNCINFIFENQLCHEIFQFH